MINVDISGLRNKSAQYINTILQYKFHAINDDFQTILNFHIVQIYLFLIKFDMLLELPMVGFSFMIFLVGFSHEFYEFSDGNLPFVNEIEQ